MNALAILAIVGIFFLAFCWVVAVDWCVVGIIKHWRQS